MNEFRMNANDCPFRDLDVQPEIHRCAFREPHRVGSLLADGSADPNLPAAGGARPLHMAAASPEPKAADGIAALLAANADPAAVDAAGATPAFWAARWGTIETLEALRAGSEAGSRTDRLGRGIGHWFAMGSPEDGAYIDDYLADECGIPFSGEDTNGWEPIHWAAAVGGRTAAIVKRVDGAALAGDAAGWPPVFHVALGGGSFEALADLVAAGADPEAAAGSRKAADFANSPERWREAVAGYRRQEPEGP